MSYVITKNELRHHGIKGQKWGDRRFQNEDGSLTQAGKERYSNGNSKRESAIRYQKMKSSEKTYTKDDPDFKMHYSVSDDEAEKHRLGDTDFYLYTRPDGSKVMFEEDMKWDIPKGMTDEEIEEATKGLIAGWKNDSERLTKMADDVIKGKYGNGADRVKALGKDYDRVQEIVNARLKIKHAELNAAGYELYHHGILGQKWGQRRFQNPDGTYTAEGKARRRREDSYSEDHKRYTALKKKRAEELSTKEIEEINRRDSALYNYNKNNKVGKDWVNKLASKTLEKSAEAIAVWAVYTVGKKYIKKILSNGAAIVIRG